jgi:putative oxidoreductase
MFPPMKIATIVVRVLLGALFLFASVSYFLKLMPQPPLEGAMKTFNEGLEASGYIMPVVKTIELICGLALLAGRFVPLALILLAPIVVNIFGVHLMLERSGLPMAVIVAAATLFLAYAHRDKYKSLFVSK